MDVFQDIHLGWGGRDYVIPSGRVMGAIATIENFVTLKELFDGAEKGNVKMATLAMAYGAVLRYAGAKVDDQAIYAGMFGKKASKAVPAAIGSLLAMMVPASIPLDGKDPPKGNSETTAAPSSKRRSKRRSRGG